MIDLHIHSNYSDGTDDISDILKKAEKFGLKYISITDHNNCKAYDELNNSSIRNIFSGKIIKGIEMNTKILDIPIEVLGYGVDTDKMNSITENLYLKTEDRNKLEFTRLLKKCSELGIKLNDNIEKNYDGKIYASKYLHTAIIQNDENKKFIDNESWENSNVFYRKYMSNPNTKLFVNVDDILPSFDKVCKVIKDCGGLIFIPHIYEYRENSNKILEAILKKDIIDGIECFYTTFSKEQSDFLVNICKQYNLFMSGGSDYHGTFKPDVEMGTGKGNLQIEERVIKNWINKVNII